MSHLDTWTTADVDLAIAEIEIEADTGRYGESLTEATNPLADPTAYGPYRYVAHGPFKNEAEAAAGVAEAQFKADGGTVTPGMFWTVEKVENPSTEP